MDALVPQPSVVSRRDGQVTLTMTTAIHVDHGDAATGVRLQQALRPATGLPLPLIVHDAQTSPPAAAEATAQPGSQIIISRDAALPAEGYRIIVGPHHIQLVGADEVGAGWAVETLRQLLPAAIYRRAPVAGQRWTVPACDITDAPRFGWRGFMLDVARHFVPKDAVLRIIDLLAIHRFNVLQLHLTEDQGWRMEIRRYPRLTQIGGWRTGSQLGAGPDADEDGRPHGGFYSQDDLREIVGYAAQRGITVVPEIDLPGHSQAAIAAYPELGVTGAPLAVWTRWGVSENVLNAEESTVEFFCNVLDEVAEVFPSTVIGIGGDECPRTQWLADARTRQLMEQRGIKDGDGLQAWFTARWAEHLRSLGRVAYCWDEVLNGELPAETLIGCWRNASYLATAAERGLRAVACPEDWVYLDWRQSADPREPIPVARVTDLARTYAFDPVPAGLPDDQQQLIIGGQANLWTEHIDSPRVLDYLLLPRLAAVAEALWSDRDRDLPHFLARLAGHLQRLDAFGVEYRPQGGPQPWQQRPGVPGRPG